MPEPGSGVCNVSRSLEQRLAKNTEVYIKIVDKPGRNAAGKNMPGTMAKDVQENTGPKAGIFILH